MFFSFYFMFTKVDGDHLRCIDWSQSTGHFFMENVSLLVSNQMTHVPSNITIAMHNANKLQKVQLSSVYFQKSKKYFHHSELLRSLKLSMALVKFIIVTRIFIKFSFVHISSFNIFKSIGLEVTYSPKGVNCTYCIELMIDAFGGGCTE